MKKKEQEKQELAQKLEALYGEKPAPPSGKPFYDDFDSYAKDYPEGERFRAWLTNRGNRKVALFLMSSVDGAWHEGLPGHYLALSMSEFRGEIIFSVHDCDDGLCQRRWPVAEREQAEKVLAEMKALAPFDMRESVSVFGFKWE